MSNIRKAPCTQRRLRAGKSPHRLHRNLQRGIANQYSGVSLPSESSHFLATEHEGSHHKAIVQHLMESS